VLIEGHTITSIGPTLRVSDAEVIDASKMIVMPGFVDTHRHIWEGILKNIAPDALLDEYFHDILGVLAPVYRPEDAYAGNLVSALGAIDAGVSRTSSHRDCRSRFRRSYPRRCCPGPTSRRAAPRIALWCVSSSR
jgi:cytosine/adenosine deaminase-related metal-dependent hydrolase